MRAVLPTPLGRLVRPWALIEFTGRTSGRRYRTPVGWYSANGVPIVITPAPWRINFRGHTDTTVHHRGRKQQLIGTLVTDAVEVAHDLQAVVDGGTPAARFGVKSSAGHRFTPDDVKSVDRAIIRFGGGQS
jgi:hypothetical protein